MVNLRYAPRKKREDGWQKFGPRDDAMSGMRGPYDTAQDERTQDAPTQERRSFLDGGDLGWRDGLGLALMGIGDAFTVHGGGKGGALDDMLGRAYSAKDMAKKAQAKALEDAAKYQDAFRSIKNLGYDDATADVLAKGYMNPSDVKKETFSNKAGDRIGIGPDGKPSTLYRDNNPMFMNTQNSVYALDAHTGGRFGGEQQQQQSTAPGTIENGYQFMGGDETDQRNWKKVGGAGQVAPRPFR